MTLFHTIIYNICLPLNPEPQTPYHYLTQHNSHHHNNENQSFSPNLFYKLNHPTTITKLSNPYFYPSLYTSLLYKIIYLRLNWYTIHRTYCHAYLTIICIRFQFFNLIQQLRTERHKTQALYQLWQTLVLMLVLTHKPKNLINAYNNNTIP